MKLRPALAMNPPDSAVSPYLEPVGIQEQESFKVWARDYPCETVLWHFRPKYENNLIANTTGRFLVGAESGAFSPGRLFMVDPNLPHNWVGEILDRQPVALRVNGARELMVASEQPITAVRHACGFSNLSDSSRQFPSLKSMPPSRFRSYHRPNAASDASTEFAARIASKLVRATARRAAEGSAFP
ncbi:MAG: hypothetical protein ABI589_15835 [Burkholderiales bacterium]